MYVGLVIVTAVVCCVGTLIARSIYKQSSELGFSCSVKRQKGHVNGRHLAVTLSHCYESLTNMVFYK